MSGGENPAFPEGVTALKLSEVNRNAIIAGGTTVNDRVRKLLLILTATMVLILAALVLMFLNINAQYDSILKNADIAAGFNTEFKNSIDSAMYDHVITPRDEDSVARLPTRELDEAVEVLRRMEQTTVLKDNVWRVHSMLNMCENLRRYMTEIALEPSYDTRMELLDRNIRGETGLTLLIENYMHDYIDDEQGDNVPMATEEEENGDISVSADDIGDVDLDEDITLDDDFGDFGDEDDDLDDEDLLGTKDLSEDEEDLKDDDSFGLGSFADDAEDSDDL